MNKAKQSVVDTLVSKITKEPNFVLIKFEKTSHKTLEALRRELKKNDAALLVTKNTLLEKAFNKLSQVKKEYREIKTKHTPLKGVSAILTLNTDWSTGLKAFHTFTDKEKSLGFKFGILDNTPYDSANLQKIAMLPSKNELVGKLLGTLKGPTANTVYAMKFNMQKLVYILSQKGGN